jgi:hypothetical protein
MSKLKGELSYEDWCILKHALAEKVGMEEDILSDYDCIAYKSDEEFDEMDAYTLEHFDKDKFLKELSEEKLTLDRVTELIDRFKMNIN